MEPHSKQLKEILEKIHPDRIASRKRRNEILSRQEMEDDMNNHYAVGDDVICQYGLQVGKVCLTFSMFFCIDIVKNKISKITGGTSKIIVKGQFTFNSFHNTVTNGRLEETRIAKGVDKSEMMKNIMEMYHYFIICNFLFGNEKNIGDAIILQLGEYYSETVAKQLKKTYGGLAIIEKMKNKYISTFRSPLRKARDVFVLRQIYAMFSGLDNYEMMYYVCGGDLSIFNTYFMTDIEESSENDEDDENHQKKKKQKK